MSCKLVADKKSDNLSYFSVTNHELTKSHENTVIMLGFSEPNCNTLCNFVSHAEFSFH